MILSTPEKSAERASLFLTTRWSTVLRARDKSEAALNSLCLTYREPMLRWLQANGLSKADAEDIVQGFLAHAVRREFLNGVTMEKGRFRTFLLTCLKNYLADQYARARAAKRGGGCFVESLDAQAAEGGNLHRPADDHPTPDRQYDRAWANIVLDRAFRRLHEECARQGHVLLLSELEPVLFADETAATYREIGAKLGMAEGAVGVAAHRIRIRLKGLIREEIMDTVGSEEDFEDETRYLIELFEH